MCRVAVGIDPGAGGALAIISPTGDLLDVQDMPVDAIKVGKNDRNRVSAARLAHYFRVGLDGIKAHVFVEQVGPNPHDGVAGAFAFGGAYRVVEGVLAGMNIPHTFILPAKWQSSTLTPKGKDGSRQRAAQLFPASAGLFARAKDDGRSDAALIAFHGFKMLCRGDV